MTRKSLSFFVFMASNKYMFIFKGTSPSITTAMTTSTKSLTSEMEIATKLSKSKVFII
jgi:hypothetical protein